MRAIARNPKVGRALVVLILGALLLVPLPQMFRMPATAMEEGSIVEYATLTLHGSVPTKDFWTEYGPLNVYVPTVAFAAVHPSINIERTVGLLYRVVLVGGVYWLLRRHSKRGAWIGAAISWCTIAPFGLMAYSWVGGLGFALVGLAALTSALDRDPPHRNLLLLSGASYGIALGFRPDLILVVAIPAAILLWRRRFTLKPLLLAFGVAMLPYLYFIATAGFGNAFRNLVIDPLFHLRDGRALPLPPSFTTISEFFTRVSSLAYLHRVFGGPLAGQVALFFWLMVGGLIVIVATVLGRRRVKDKRWIALVAAVALLTSNFLQRADFSHFRQVGTFWLPVVPVAVALLLRQRCRSMPRVVGTSAALLVVIGSLVATTLWTQPYVELLTPGGKADGLVSRHTIHINSRSIPIDDSLRALMMHRAGEVVAVLAVPGQTLFEGPSDLRFTNYNEPIFYWLEPKLKPSTYFLEMNPGISNTKDSGLAQQVDQAHWVILSEVYKRFSEPNTSIVPGSDAPNVVLTHHFCAVDSTSYYSVLEHLPPGQTTNPLLQVPDNRVLIDQQYVTRCEALPSNRATTTKLADLRAFGVSK